MKFLFLLLLSTTAWGRPVSFFEGAGLMVENRVPQTEIMTNFTFHPRWSFGAHYAQLRDRRAEQDYGYALLTYLPVRKNWDQWQANTYLSIGAGARERQGSGYGALEADVESRKYYFSVKAEGYDLVQDKVSSYARARAGFAPYLSESQGLHSFIILQLDHYSWVRRNKTDLTPLLRFFYQNLLFELGASVNGRFQLNFSTEI